MALFVCSWLWGSKWGGCYADRLFAAVDRNLRQPYQSVLITDQPITGGADVVVPINEEDRPLLARPGCLVRMRMFDAKWQAGLAMSAGDRVVCVDVDAVITGPLDPLFERADEFTIMQGFNTTNPCPFNGSLWMFRAGQRHDVWDEFGIDAHAKYNVPIHQVADDQGWLHARFPNAAAYTPADGVYAFKKVGWTVKGRRKLPENARLVAFPGRDPAKYPEVDWLKKHWVGQC